ncbi:hypothetical protein H6G97_31170 [Nostoc flagelliforme FACHB-838]|uniref:Transposase n=1 Tax=Nostoc flagelliforme FACHB-838 TaxID=2692904 RepID=A0ABR8DWH4_9NOSO|nr:hypothetical protein [Nostoc flagelliforme]MBD2533776.1 hypothetical protein [Nostoc flagelliforme FACHB-838]
MNSALYSWERSQEGGRVRHRTQLPSCGFIRGNEVYRRVANDNHWLSRIWLG